MATRIEIADIQTELLRRIEERAGSELIQICKDGEPVAAIQFLGRLWTPADGPRPVGQAPGQVVIPPEFFIPMKLVDDLGDD